MDKGGILNFRGDGQIEMVRVHFFSFIGIDHDSGTFSQRLDRDFLSGNSQISISLQVNAFNVKGTIQMSVLN